MVINFEITLLKAFEEIAWEKEYYVFPVKKEDDQSSLNSYGEGKWKIVDLLNIRFGTGYNLYHWLYYNEEDEVAYFLNEAGSNAINYSQRGWPLQFHLWIGKKGFIIGIEQEGNGFDARTVFEKKIKSNEGDGFSFYENCNSLIFFDNPDDARAVYILVMV